MLRTAMFAATILACVASPSFAGGSKPTVVANVGVNTKGGVLGAVLGKTSINATAVVNTKGGLLGALIGGNNSHGHCGC